MTKQEFIDYCILTLRFHESKTIHIGKVYDLMDDCTIAGIAKSKSKKQYIRSKIGKQLGIVGTGRINGVTYWEARGYPDPAKALSESQSKATQAAVDKGAFKGRFSEEWFINKYGTIEGPIKYTEHKEMRSTSNKKETRIEKIGEEGWQEFIDKSKQTLENFIKRHGEEEGTKLFNTFAAKSAQTEANFITRHGKVEGRKLWKEYTSKLGMTLEKCKLRHGEEEGLKVYNKWIERFIATKIKLGYIRPDYLDLKSDWELYQRQVNKETNINMIEIPGIENRSIDLHLDHKYSKVQGFIDGILPHIIGHYSNLEMLSRFENTSKGRKCSITKEELIEGYSKSQIDLPQD